MRSCLSESSDSTTGPTAPMACPRIYEDLIEEDVQIGRKRIARLMREAGLRGVCRRRWTRTTRRSSSDRPAEDLVDRTFTADGPNQLWVADITYIPTWAGFLYLAVVMDVWSRKIVGWAMAPHLRTNLVLAALEMAIEQRRPRDVIHHSDQGSQYTSIAFGRRCRQAGVRPSMGSVGDCYDNAMCESFFATLECERIDRRTYRTHAEARLDIFPVHRRMVQPPPTPQRHRTEITHQLRKASSPTTRPKPGTVHWTGVTPPIVRRAALLAVAPTTSRPSGRQPAWLPEAN